MSHEGTIVGVTTRQDLPYWRPLLDLVGSDLADWFMWMFAIDLADGFRAHAYKHVATRRYLHLAEDGRAFLYVGDEHYREIAPRHAIDAAFMGWDRLIPTPPDPTAFRVALSRARATARASLQPERGRGVYSVGRASRSSHAHVPGTTSAMSSNAIQPMRRDNDAHVAPLRCGRSRWSAAASERYSRSRCP